MRGHVFFVMLLLVGVIAGWKAETHIIDEENLPSATNQSDSLALVAFYLSTEWQQWVNSTQWLSGSVDSWYGVTVENGRVTRIELPENNIRFPELRGVVAPEIGDLEFLRVLDLSGNGLSGRVPDAFLKLTRLEELSVQDNFLDELPDLSQLKDHAMITLNVAGNLLTFEDLEPLANQGFVVEYAPQRPFALPLLPNTAYEGERVLLNAGVGGSANEYQWYLEDFRLQGATNSQYAIDPVSEANIGPYSVEVTSALLPDLVLKSTLKRLNYIKKYEFQWLDIGEYHNVYAAAGGRREGGTDGLAGMEYPAILRHAGHLRSNAFWVGVQNWTDPDGWTFPYYVTRIGGRSGGYIPQSVHATPLKHELIGRYEDTVVEVNGESGSDNVAVLDAVDPALAADRMIHNVINLATGITLDRKIYAFTNEFHDNYHIIDQTFCNTGNIDADDDIELPNQTLEEVIFFRSNSWRGSEQGAWATAGDQVWGRYTMHDVVGDGYEEYPVDFTAQYGWIGWGIQSYERDYDDLGAPLFQRVHETIAPGDTIGRLAASTMMGRSVIHADRSTSDPSYDRGQPSIISYLSNDDLINSDGSTHEAYYRLGIVAPTLGYEESRCIPCRRVYPHFADFVVGTGRFEEINLGSTGATAGGYAATAGYGPYTMGPGECINITESEGVDGLSFDAATKIGQAYKSIGSSRDTDPIQFDANADGLINSTAFNYDEVFVGSESQTKNQWVMSARDSLFQTFYRARDVFEASQNMSVYPIVEPPRAPLSFTLRSRPPDGVAIDWMPASEGPRIVAWELFRTENREDNLYVNGCLEDASVACGYERVATLSAEATSFIDTDVEPGIKYYYYLQGVGESQPDDLAAMAGTPGGVALRSSRYLTQTYVPISTVAPEFVETEVLDRITLVRNFPNPFVESTTIQYWLPSSVEVKLKVYNILGREVETLVSSVQGAGYHQVVFEPKGLASGVYIYVLQAGDMIEEETMLLVK